MGFIFDAEALLKEKGKDYRVGRFSSMTDRMNLMMPGKDYTEAQREAYQAMFGAFDDGADIASPGAADDGSRPLLHLSALLSLVDYMKSPANDVWAWTKEYNVSAARDVLRAAVAISPIDRIRLQRDARIFLEYMNSLAPDNTYASLRRIVNVDIPKPNWARVESLNLNLPNIEKALYHRSEWLLELAVNLVFHAASADELEAIITRVYASGRSLTLWAGTALATGISSEIAVRLTRDRLLNQPLVSGCEYLLNLLRRLKISYDEELHSILRIGIFSGNVKVAIAASELANAIVAQNADGLRYLLLEAYEHWLINEEPYPTEGGVVPDSPRKQILSALLQVHEFQVAQLLTFAADPRSEIRDLGTSALTNRLSDDTARQQFILSALSENMPPTLLTQVLRAYPRFSEAELREICRLLKSSNPRFRYAALHALDSPALKPEEVERLIRSMTLDEEPDIREAAFRRLDQKGPSSLSS